MNKPYKKDHIWVRDESGNVFAEYTIVMILVTLVGAVAIAMLGLPLMKNFLLAQVLLTLPIP